jgi:hypothetical protein
MAQVWLDWAATPQPNQHGVHLAPTEKEVAELRRAFSYIAPGNGAGARTTAWLRGDNPKTWHALYDHASGHSVLAVSDRCERLVRPDLVLGLRLMAWLAPQSRPMRWLWADHDWDREAAPGAAPGPGSVNGGWTTLGGGTVHVYRHQEAHKVLLHELGHALGDDVAATAALDEARACIEATLRHDSSQMPLLWPNLGEAYTELLAEWRWAAAGAHSAQDAAARWQRQTECAMRRAVQVWARIRGPLGRGVPEETPAFAYYVMRAVLLQHAPEVFAGPTASVPQWCAWWMQAREHLDDAVRALPAVEVSRALALSMTCV